MKPNKIFHLGDNHVFFSKKFEAHEYVFNELYKDIEKEKPELIVLAGDLIDSKVKLSPEQFSIARNFLLNLAGYCPVLIILGNHDLNLANKERLDSVSPIVYSLNNETLYPIHFFKHSGLYELYDIKWAIWSCLDDQLAPNIVREADDYVIGLYHGAVKGCLADNGFPLTSGIDIEDFKDCDRVMLADIHRRQSFRNGEIVYCGSTLQTKISEPEKGSYVMWTWDGKNYNFEFKDLDNRYSTVTFDLDKDDASHPIVTSDDQLLVFKYDSTVINKTEANRLRKELQGKYKNKIEMKPSIKKKIKTTQTLEEVKEQKKIDLQTAMTDYLTEMNFSDKDVKAILELDAAYSANLDLTRDFEPGDFSILRMHITNFLSFSPVTQTIDFDSEGIIGIAGKNRVGKSSVIKALIFALYNSSPDNNASLKKLINKHNRKEDASVELFLAKAGKYYKIFRALTPKKTDGVTTTLEFWETDELGNEVKSLTGEKRQDTEKEIQKYFGIESAFEILSLYSAQKKQQELIECKNAERLKLINRFIGLHNYEAKTEAVGEDLKIEKGKYQAILKEFNQSKDIKVMERELNTLLSKETSIQEEILDIQESERIYEFKNRHLVSNYELNKKLASKVVASPEEAEQEIEDWENFIDERKSKLEDAVKLKKEAITTKLEIDALWASEVSDSIALPKYRINYKEADEEKNILAVLRSDIKRMKEQQLKDDCNECGRPFSDDAKLELALKISQAEAKEAIIVKSIADFDLRVKYKESLQDQYSHAKDTEDDCNTEIKKLESGIEQALVNIENQKLKSKDWDEVQAAKERLIDLEKEYMRLLSHKKDISKTLDMLQNDLGSTRTQISLLNKEIAQYKKYHQDLIDVEEKMRVFKLYKDIVNKDGLPLFILKSKIADINEQVNLIVSQVFEFEVEFSVTDGELNIEFFYENDSEKNDVGFASGSETFIINLCIKVGLSQVSELPKLTSLLIDEGYGTLDADTIAKIPALFTTLPEYYKNVITISHIDELKDLYSYEIKLQKTGKFTEVTN